MFLFFLCRAVLNYKQQEGFYWASLSDLDKVMRSFTNKIYVVVVCVGVDMSLQGHLEGRGDIVTRAPCKL